MHARTYPLHPSIHHSTQQTRRPTSLPTLNANDTIATAPGPHNATPPLPKLEQHPKHTNKRQTPPQPRINRPNTPQTNSVRQGAPPQHYTTNMTTSVPSVEDVTNAFPTAITKITGEPNYESLKILKDELKANAASIPTTLGSGTHGYLGLILSPATYATVAATQFIEPIYPGQHPNVPAGTSASNTSTIVRRHTEDLCQWREFKNVITALKNQLLSALDDIYIRALKDRHVGYMNQSIRAILQHLFDNYDNITPLELEDNDTKMRATWDPNSPFDCLVK